jgi:hypothetical protein
MSTFAAFARGSSRWSSVNLTLAGVLFAAAAATPCLLSAAPPPAGDDSTFRAAPTASVSLTRAAVRPGDSFDLDIEVRWAGAFDDYLLRPPALTPPRGLRVLRTSASSSSDGGHQRVRYQLRIEALAAAEPGPLGLGPIELRYTPRNGSEAVLAQLAGPTVEIAASVHRASGLDSLFAGLGATAIALVAGLFMVRSRRRGGRRDAAAERFRGLQARFDEARAQRRRGEAGECLATLVALETELAVDALVVDTGAVEIEAADDPTLETEPRQLRELIEQARFGGRAPAGEQLDAIERRVELALQLQRPDPRRSRRASLAHRLRTAAPRPGHAEGFLPLTLKHPRTEDG